MQVVINSRKEREHQEEVTGETGEIPIITNNIKIQINNHLGLHKVVIHIMKASSNTSQITHSNNTSREEATREVEAAEEVPKSTVAEVDIIRINHMVMVDNIMVANSITKAHITVVEAAALEVEQVVINTSQSAS